MSFSGCYEVSGLIIQFECRRPSLTIINEVRLIYRIIAYLLFQEYFKKQKCRKQLQAFYIAAVR